MQHPTLVACQLHELHFAWPDNQRQRCDSPECFVTVDVSAGGNTRSWKSPGVCSCCESCHIRCGRPCIAPIKAPLLPSLIAIRRQLLHLLKSPVGHSCCASCVTCQRCPSVSLMVRRRTSGRWVSAETARLSTSGPSSGCVAAVLRSSPCQCTSASPGVGIKGCSCAVHRHP